MFPGNCKRFCFYAPIGEMRTAGEGPSLPEETGGDGAFSEPGSAQIFSPVPMARYLSL